MATGATQKSYNLADPASYAQYLQDNGMTMTSSYDPASYNRVPPPTSAGNAVPSATSPTANEVYDPASQSNIYDPASAVRPGGDQGTPTASLQAAPIGQPGGLTPPVFSPDPATPPRQPPPMAPPAPDQPSTLGQPGGLNPPAISTQGLAPMDGLAGAAPQIPIPTFSQTEATIKGSPQASPTPQQTAPTAQNTPSSPGNNWIPTTAPSVANKKSVNPALQGLSNYQALPSGPLY